MLKVEYVRDGNVGSKTSDFASGNTVARDRDGRILGHSNDRFSNTRDGDGKLISSNQADVEGLFDW